MLGAEIDDIACKLEYSHKKSKLLLYEAGTCSLQDLVRLRASNGIYWWDRQPELVFILQRLFGFFKKLHSKDLMHSDLKPQNVVLYNSSQISQFIFDIKLIDFGAATFGYKVVKAYTSDYYVPNIEKIQIKSKKQRIKYEYYMLGRTL